MGLDFNHGDARWTYSGFKRFRNRIAKQIGFPNYQSVQRTDDPRFNAFVKDPIIILLAHSDCDGHITPHKCKQLAPRLEELISAWEDCYDKSQALRLVEGLRWCGRNRKKLEFI